MKLPVKEFIVLLLVENIFVNKYLRNYDKISDTFQQKKKEREVKYLENPKNL
jgi:hypothetical protein